MGVGGHRLLGSGQHGKRLAQNGFRGRFTHVGGRSNSIEGMPDLAFSNPPAAFRRAFET